MKTDFIGNYPYEAGWCARDAFRQYFGDHPILQELPCRCPIEIVRAFCERYGYPFVLDHGGFPSRLFRVGQAVIWIIAETPARRDCHLSFSREPQRVMDMCAEHGWALAGYILLELD